MMNSKTKLALILAALSILMAATAAFAATVATVTGDRVRIRAKPSTKSAILAEVNKGFSFEVIDTYLSDSEQYPWCKGVMNIGGARSEGWVYGQFLSVKADPNESLRSHLVSFTNMTEETILLATASEGDDGWPGAKGWQTIEAGDSLVVTFQVRNAAIGQGRPPKYSYYAKSESNVWRGDEGADSGYVIHQTEDFWCVRGKQGIYGEAGGEKYDYGKNQPAPEDSDYVLFKDLPKDGDVFVSSVTLD
jgi:uncharacterized protein YraI